MQLFVIAPALVYLVHRFKKTTIVAMLIAILISMAWIVFIHIDLNLANTYVCDHYWFVVIWWIYHSLFSYIFRYQRGLGKVFVPTHLRLPSWLIGFITGCFFVDYPMRTIRIPKVTHICQKVCTWPNFQTNWVVAFSLHLEIEFVCMDRVIGIDGSDNNCKLSILPAFKFYAVTVWAVQCVLPSIFCHFGMLHHFCVR